MPTYSPPGEQHTAFMQWAIAEGVKENEVMVEVPRSAMLSIDSIPADFVNMFNGISTHGLLAAFLTHGDPKTLKRYDLWKATWPTLPDFEEGMPILWSKELGGSGLKTPISTIATTSHQHDLSPITLPPSVSGLWNTFHKKPLAEEYTTKHQNLLAQQEARLREAWRDVIAVFPDTDWEKFSYHWLIVNTRSFYYLMPGQDPPEDTNDAMAMVPFADYFNHTDDAECEVHFDGKSYTFRATRLYNSPNPNKMQITDGFYLETNESDAIFLDDIIFKDFTVAEKEELIRQRYYGSVLPPS
uniref:Ribosomal N-lysine methyltransferase set11 n=1 Tax=Talaromyces marneffei PM1 TaxID=1077442 RepID=A0A093XW75_TALMA